MILSKYFLFLVFRPLNEQIKIVAQLRSTQPFHCHNTSPTAALRHQNIYFSLNIWQVTSQVEQPQLAQLIPAKIQNH